MAMIPEATPLTPEIRSRHFRLETVIMLVLTVGLSACYESTDISLHKPGEYKGRQDPLVRAQAAEKREQILLDRFRQIQTDR